MHSWLDLCGGHVWVVAAEMLLCDCERLLEQLKSLRKLALFPVDVCKAEHMCVRM